MAIIKEINNMYREKKHYKMIKNILKGFSSGQLYIAGYKM